MEDQTKVHKLNFLYETYIAERRECKSPRGDTIERKNCCRNTKKNSNGIFATLLVAIRFLVDRGPRLSAGFQCRKWYKWKIAFYWLKRRNRIHLECARTSLTRRTQKWRKKKTIVQVWIRLNQLWINFTPFSCEMDVDEMATRRNDAAKKLRWEPKIDMP